MRSNTVESSIPEDMTIHEWRHRKTVTRTRKTRLIVTIKKWLGLV